MGNAVKITKKEFYVALRGLVEAVETVGEIPSDAVLEFIDKQVAQLDAKAAKAKEKAGEKKAEGDSLRSEVFACVTNEWQTGDQITAALDNGEVTKAKVTARLTQLVKSNQVEKDLQKVGERKLTVYRLASIDAE